MVLLSDYDKGILTPSLTRYLISAANAQNIKVLVDPKGEDYSKYANAFLITPNKKETETATNIKIDSSDSLEHALASLKNKLHLEFSIATLSEEGIAIYDDKLMVMPAFARDVFDVTGAGDTVLAALGFALARNDSIYESVEFANLAAGVVTGKIGSATATLAEINMYKASFSNSVVGSNIKSRDEIGIISNISHRKNHTIVFTNGCFDILHSGHVTYLSVAKSLGGLLIVGLNSDSSTKKLKGENRPVNNEKDRAIVLSALKCVDYVVLFDEETPYELIKLISPNILVKGSDYENKDVVGSDIVSDVRFIPMVEGKSTTAIIDKIYSEKM